jgi:hypothetical protein
MIVQLNASVHLSTKKYSGFGISTLFRDSYFLYEETFDVIKRAHIATGHGGRDRMIKELGKKYANVTRDSIELFKSMCIDCQRKRVYVHELVCNLCSSL